jgi:hypothetical protein
VTQLSQEDAAVFSGSATLFIAEPVPLYPTNLNYQFIRMLSLLHRCLFSHIVEGNLNAAYRVAGKVLFVLIAQWLWFFLH